MWREAWVEDNFIVIHCVPEELEKYHVSDLKEDIVNANTKYRQYLFEQVRIVDAFIPGCIYPTTREGLAVRLVPLFQSNGRDERI